MAPGIETLVRICPPVDRESGRTANSQQALAHRTTGGITRFGGGEPRASQAATVGQGGKGGAGGDAEPKLSISGNAF